MAFILNCYSSKDHLKSKSFLYFAVGIIGKSTLQQFQIEYSASNHEGPSYFKFKTFFEKY